MLQELFNIIEKRKHDHPEGSYTCQLMDAGEDRILRKINEETFEVVLAAKSEGNQRLVEESADLIYHLWVLLSYKNIDLSQVEAELEKRHQGDR